MHADRSDQRKNLHTLTSVYSPAIIPTHKISLCCHAHCSHSFLRSENLNGNRRASSSCEFRIRAQPDHWIALEVVRPSSERVPTHVYVGPEGHVVSGAAGPISVPGKLFVAHAKVNPNPLLRYSETLQYALSIRKSFVSHKHRNKCA